MSINNNFDDSLSNSKTVFVSLTDLDKQSAKEMVEKHQILSERFILEEIIGVGGMGVVYRAIDKIKQATGQKDHHVAIKVLSKEVRKHPESLLALQRETYKEQMLAHPNLLKVYDFNRDGDVVYKVMELIKGKHLKQVIQELSKKPIKVDKKHIKHCFRIAYEISVALDYAHQHGIIHSDLKPSNVFIDHNDNVKVFDFGIARTQKKQSNLTANDDESIFDPTTFTAFTPKYASLEMLNGEKPYWADDIYALGCILYELLTGTHPFNGKTAKEVLNDKLIIPKINDLPEQYQQVVDKCLALKRQNRYNNMKQVQQAIVLAEENPNKTNESSENQKDKTIFKKWQQKEKPQKESLPKTQKKPQKQSLKRKEKPKSLSQSKSLKYHFKTTFNYRNNYFILALSTILSIILLFYLENISYHIFKTGSVTSAILGNTQISCQSALSTTHPAKSNTYCSINNLHENNFLSMEIVKPKQGKSFAIQTLPLTKHQVYKACHNSQTCDAPKTNSNDPYLIKSIDDLNVIQYSLNHYSKSSITLPTLHDYKAWLGVQKLEKLCDKKYASHLLNQPVSIVLNKGSYYVIGIKQTNGHCQVINETLAHYGNKGAAIRFLYQPNKVD